MTKNGTCPIWGTVAEIDSGSGAGTFVQSPRAGGNYFVTLEAEAILQYIDERQKALLTTWLIDQRQLGVQYPRIETTTVKDANQWLDLSVRERTDRLLKYFRQL